MKPKVDHWPEITVQQFSLLLDHVDWRRETVEGGDVLKFDHNGVAWGARINGKWHIVPEMQGLLNLVAVSKEE